MKTSGIIILLSVLLIMCSCNKPGSMSASSVDQEMTVIDSTGHSDGRYEVSYLCIEGKLYQSVTHQYSFKNRSEAKKYLDEKGYEAIGVVAKCDPYNIPKTDYAATYLEVGTELYYSTKEGEAAAINEEKQIIEYFTQTQ